MGQSLNHQIDQTPATVGPGTTQVDLRLRVWYASTSAVTDSFNKFELGGGAWPSRNTSVDISLSGGGSQLIYDETITVQTAYGSSKTRSFTAQISGINYWGGTASTSGSKTVDARPVAAPSKVGTPGKSQVDSSGAKITWDPPSAWNGENADDYELQWWATGNYAGAVTQVKYNTREHHITGADPNQEINARVRAFNSAGPGEWSNTVTFTTAALLPNQPTDVSVSRDTDSRQILTWDRTATSSRPYDGQRVQRQTDGGDWETIATLPGGMDDYVDTTTERGHQYRYRLRGENSSGVGDWGVSNIVSTTPNDPSDCIAKKVGSDIRISWDNETPYDCEIEIEHRTNGGSWSLLTTRPAGAVQHTHSSPNNSVTHQYRVRAVAPGTSLSSSFTWSGVVELAAPPNAPTTTGPDGTLDATDPITFTWRHNPVDATDQSAYELRYRYAGETTWTTTGKVTTDSESVTLAGDTYTNGNTPEWQVRTWAQHADPSDWSATAAFDVAARPSATIDSPTDAQVLASSELTVEWSIFQAQGHPQAAWRVTLLDEYADETLESRSGNGTTSSLALATELEDGLAYTVQVEVQSSAGLWSPPVQTSFSVEFLPPVDGQASAQYVRENGSTVVTVVPDAPEVGVTEAAATARLLRSIDGGPWVTVETGVDLTEANGATITDPVPTLNGINTYRVVLVTALGATRVVGAGRAARTNLVRNPCASVTTQGVSSSNGNVAQASGSGIPAGPDMFFRVTIHTDKTTGGDVLPYGLASWTPESLPAAAVVEPDTTYTASFWVRMSKDYDVKIQAQSISGSSGGTTPTPTYGPDTHLTANTWTRLSITFTTPPAGMAAVRIDLDTVGPMNLLAGDTIDVTGYQLEAASTLGEYFDGDTLPQNAEPDYYFTEWAGAAGDSPSILRMRHDDQHIEVREPGLSYFNYGPGLGNVAVMITRPQPSGTAGRAKTYHQFAGRPKRVLFAGDATTLAVTTSGRLTGDGQTSDLTTWEQAALNGIGCYRDAKGRRIFGGLESFTHQWISPTVADVSFTFEETDYDE